MLILLLNVYISSTADVRAPKYEIILDLDYAHEHGTDRDEIADWVWPL